MSLPVNIDEYSRLVVLDANFRRGMWPFPSGNGCSGFVASTPTGCSSRRSSIKR